MWLVWQVVSTRHKLPITPRNETVKHLFHIFFSWNIIYSIGPDDKTDYYSYIIYVTRTARHIIFHVFEYIFMFHSWKLHIVKWATIAKASGSMEFSDWVEVWAHLMFYDRVTCNWEIQFDKKLLTFNNHFDFFGVITI